MPKKPFAKMSFRRRVKLILDRMTARRLKGKLARPVMNNELTRVYPVTYPYGVRNSGYAAGYHTGQDHACPEGSLALATTWGKVIHAGPGAGAWGEAYGNQVIIRTGDGKYDYAFCHLRRALVKEGDTVKPGTLVGRTGSTGNVTGPHVHFEVRVAGGRYGSDVHPVNVLKRKKKKKK